MISGDLAGGCCQLLAIGAPPSVDWRGLPILAYRDTRKKRSVLPSTGVLRAQCQMLSGTYPLEWEQSRLIGI